MSNTSTLPVNPPSRIDKLTAWDRAIERAESAADRIASKSAVVLAAFTILFFAITIELASRKLLWDDEFFTLYLSMTSGWHSLMQALSTGADQHPPSFYLLTHAVLRLFGTTPVTLRLPATAGFWLMCVCLYETTRRVTNRTWAILALLVPTANWSYFYAFEARGYGLMLGFSALALLSWIWAAEGGRRWLSIPLLAISLACAAGSHYYAVFTVIPLAAGEIVRTYCRQRLDPAIWAAFCGILALPVLFVQTIWSARGYSAHFWARPNLTAAFDYYPDLSGYSVDLLIAVGALALLSRAILKQTRPAKAEDVRPPWLLAAFISFGLLPVLIVFVARFVTHGFTNRYALAAMLGLTVIACQCLYELAGHRSVVALGAILLCLLCGAVTVRAYWFSSANTVRATRDEYAMLRAKGDVPIAVSEISAFHRLSFYTPRAFASRLAYVADPDASIRYLGHDTVDRGLLDLNPWFPLNTVPAEPYFRDHPFFLTFGHVGDWSWLTYELPKRQARIQLLDRYSNRILLSVEGAKPDPAANVYRPPYPAKLISTVPVSGPSLCEQYFGRAPCPGF